MATAEALPKFSFGHLNFKEDVQDVCREVAAVLGHMQVPPCLVERPGSV